MKQVFCAIHIVCLTLKELIARAIAHQKEIIHNLKVRKKFVPQKIAQPSPLQKIMVSPLADSNHIQGDFQCNLRKLMGSVTRIFARYFQFSLNVTKCQCNSSN